MAARDHLGLQVALIVSVILVIGLGVTNFMSCQKASSDAAKAADLEKQVQQANQVRDQFQFKYAALKFMITEGLVINNIDPAKDPVAQIREQLENQLSTKAPGALSDEEVKKIAENYYRHMAAFGVDSDLQRNYSNLPDYLMQVVSKKNQEYVTLTQANQKLISEKNNLEDQLKKAEQEFNTKLAACETDKQKQKATFDQERDRITQEKDQLAQQLQTKDAALARCEAERKKSNADYQKQIADLKQVNFILNRRLADYEKASFESPDGYITVVNHRLRLCYIDVGSDDGVRPQMTFSVYDSDASEVMIDRPKGSIEVVKVVGPHQTLCKITDDDVDNIIREGDIIHTPAWDPGRPVHFAIAGFLDINEDGVSDKPLVINLIKLAGGVIDDTVTPETRFLVLGLPRSDKPGAEMTARESAAYAAVTKAAEELGVDRISPAKLVSYMGWRGDIKVATIGHAGQGGLQIKPGRGAVKDPQAVIEDFKKELEWQRKKRGNPAKEAAERVEAASGQKK